MLEMDLIGILGMTFCGSDKNHFYLEIGSQHGKKHKI